MLRFETAVHIYGTNVANLGQFVELQKNLTVFRSSKPLSIAFYVIELYFYVTLYILKII